MVWIILSLCFQPKDIPAMNCHLVKKGIWSRAVPAVNSHTSTAFKLNNPFANEKPFRPSYESDKSVDMNRLYHSDYHRIWIKEHDEYLARRNSKFETPKKQFPIYRKVVKAQGESKSDLSKKPNKKYAHVKPKVKTFFPNKMHVYWIWACLIE